MSVIDIICDSDSNAKWAKQPVESQSLFDSAREMRATIGMWGLRRLDALVQLLPLGVRFELAATSKPTLIGEFVARVASWCA